MSPSVGSISRAIPKRRSHRSVMQLTQEGYHPGTPDSLHQASKIASRLQEEDQVNNGGQHVTRTRRSVSIHSPSQDEKEEGKRFRRSFLPIKKKYVPRSFENDGDLRISSKEASSFSFESFEPFLSAIPFFFTSIQRSMMRTSNGNVSTRRGRTRATEAAVRGADAQARRGESHRASMRCVALAFGAIHGSDSVVSEFPSVCE